MIYLTKRASLLALFAISFLFAYDATAMARARGEPAKAADLADVTYGGKLQYVQHTNGERSIVYLDRHYFGVMESSVDNRSQGAMLRESDIKTWTKLSDLPKQLRDQLIAWDRSTTEEDIRAICSAETSPILGKLPDGSKRWVRADYLRLVKKWIKDGKLPFTFELKTRAESTSPTGSVTLGAVAHLVRDKHGNFVSTTLVPEGGSVEYHMSLVKENFEDMGDHVKLMEDGGFAVLFVRNRYGVESSSLATFFHEITHILDSVYRVQYNQEASPEANKLFFLGTISKKDFERHFSDLRK